MLGRFVSLAAAAATVLAAPTALEARSPSGSKSEFTSSHAAERELTIIVLAVIIQMFEWTWASIAAECTNFIGPAGYGFVQVSCHLPPIHVNKIYHQPRSHLPPSTLLATHGGQITSRCHTRLRLSEATEANSR